MRIVGAVLVAFGAALLGRYWVFRLRTREENLAALLRLISRIQTELEYNSPPMDALLESLYSADKALDFLLDCRENMETGVSFPEAWERAVQTLAISGEDRKSLITFGAGLGTTDVAGQSRQCRLYREIFAKSHANAESERKKYAAYLPKLSLLLGLCCGILLL